MTRRLAKTLLAIWATAMLALVGLLFLGTSVAPCLGGVGPEGHAIRARCAAAWEAQRPWIDRFIDTPVPSLLVIALAIAGTVLVLWKLRRRGAPSTHD
jgi:hypothetical protein